MTYLDELDYQFPVDLIASKPTTPRENARLLVFDRKSNKITHTTFKNICDFLPAGALIVFNETKVIPARFSATKESGGKVTLLFLRIEKENIICLSNRKLSNSEILRTQSGENFTVVEKVSKGYALKPNFEASKIFEFLDRFGTAPLPPYIKGSPLSEEEKRLEYQTVFSKNPGSVAAPTASLHFSDKLLESMREQGFKIAFVTLHVGLGTFAPVTAEQLESKKLHSEWFEVSSASADLLNTQIESNAPIIAVGSTVVRTLESACGSDGKVRSGSGETQIFIQSSDDLRVVTGLVTNFHVPKSSLMMLVAAFTGKEKLLEIYNTAVEEKYRLFSFGDGMLVI